ncbi:helix-turn-helix transcriptional regulator [Streptomyces niveiscabiei]|uniref:helix-turn-helix transcriptional regulator n=1 Tax=Streptomyces niveiscabiei TaxID=164115 RepID=UPI0029A1BCEF|nr:helix-turn-helix transcriptional regulator [Streptomyces niveiscabiei]MDX3382924.1 helix-turn-helix transcriptional regulator [Streptomyces niveiscabiei]
MTAPHVPHGTEELCAPGAELYERALAEGHIPAADAEAAPCLVDAGLLHPSVDDLTRLEPLSPTVALHRMLRRSARRIADERRREEQLTEIFGKLVRLDPDSPPAQTPMLTILSSKPRINEAITEAVAEATQEILTIQPNMNLHGAPIEAARAVSVPRDQQALDRGCRIRTLYQHTMRNAPTIRALHERLHGDASCRTLDQITDRLIAVDGAVAFIPANEDNSLALEVRHPAVVKYFVTTFDRLWHLATPLYPEPAREHPALNTVTPRQRTIAALLVEGHTDAVIADRLGMNVRTAREHIAKLATTLGSDSRAQLGYLIARSGILDGEATDR